MRVVASIAAALLLPSMALAAEAALGIDWQAKVIRVKGSGAPDTQKAANVAVARLNAERAAKMDAYRNAVEQLKGVQVTSGSAAGALLDDAVTRARVESLIRGAKLTDTKYFEDGGVDVFLEIPLDALAAELVPAGDGKKAAAVGAASWTGLVVDARGAKVAPALAPKLVDEGGKELYSSQWVTKDALRERGVAGYRKDLDSAKGEAARVGANPLVVKAVKAVGVSDLALAGTDAEKLRDPKTNVSFLAEGRVIIVTD